VAWAGNRALDGKGKLPAIGSTVNVEQATYTDTIGANELIADWEDPTFRAGESACTTRACSRSRRRAGPRTSPCRTSFRPHERALLDPGARLDRPYLLPP
jgi:hypothetical protein